MPEAALIRGGHGEGAAAPWRVLSVVGLVLVACVCLATAMFLTLAPGGWTVAKAVMLLSCLGAAPWVGFCAANGVIGFFLRLPRPAVPPVERFDGAVPCSHQNKAGESENFPPGVILGLDPRIGRPRHRVRLLNSSARRKILGSSPRMTFGSPRMTGKDRRQNLRTSVAHAAGLRLLTWAMNVRDAGAGRSRCRVQPPASGILGIQPPRANRRIAGTARLVAKR